VTVPVAADSTTLLRALCLLATFVGRRNVAFVRQVLGGDDCAIHRAATYGAVCWACSGATRHPCGDIVGISGATQATNRWDVLGMDIIKEGKRPRILTLAGIPNRCRGCLAFAGCAGTLQLCCCGMRSALSAVPARYAILHADSGYHGAPHFGGCGHRFARGLRAGTRTTTGGVVTTLLPMPACL